MALKVTEFAEIAVHPVARNTVPLPIEDGARTHQSVVTTAVSAAFQPSTIAVYLVAEENGYIRFGTGTPTASSAYEYIPAGVPIYRAVRPGHKVGFTAA
jgi:hypothetical protein